MTLQAWGFLVLASLFFFLNWGANAQSVSPSVWEQMQNASSAQYTIKAVISAVELGGQSVLVDVTPVRGRSKMTGLSLCLNAQAPTALSAHRIEVLRQALRTKEVVELGLVGPWNPCLNTIRVSR